MEEVLRTAAWELHYRGSFVAFCNSVSCQVFRLVESSWNVMAYGGEREGKWRGKWRMGWVASTLRTTSEHGVSSIRLRLKCDGTRAETRFRLSAKRTSPFTSAGELVHSTTGSRGVHISGSNAGYTMFRGIVKGTGYPLHSPVPPSLPLPCVTVCRHISTGLHYRWCAHLGFQ